MVTGPPAGAVDLDRHAAIRRRVGDGVRQQVPQGAPDHEPVAGHGRLALERQRHAAFLHEGVVEIEELPHLASEVDRLHRRDDRAVVGLGEEQHVGHGARQALALLEAGIEDLAVFLGRARPGERDLGLHHQVAERRLELVRQVGGEVREPAERFLQAREHPVEGDGELRELGRQRLDGEAVVQAARADALRHARHVAHRRQPAPRRGPAEEPDEQRAGRDRDPQAAVEGAQVLDVVLDVERDRHDDAPGAWSRPGPGPRCRGSPGRRRARWRSRRATPAWSTRSGKLPRGRRVPATRRGRSRRRPTRRSDRWWWPVSASSRRLDTASEVVGRAGLARGCCRTSSTLPRSSMRSCSTKWASTERATSQSQQQEHARRARREEQREPQRERGTPHQAASGVCST